MMKSLLIALLLAVVAVAASQPTHILKSHLKAAPTGWTQHSRAHADADLSLVIMVAQQNIHQLTATLDVVSDPTSPFYGKHLTNEEVHAMVAPREQDVAAVLHWLSSHHIATTNETLSFSPNRDIIKVRTTVAKAENLLKSKYYRFHHKERNVHLVRSYSYSIPSHLSNVIDLIGPTTRFPSASVMRGPMRSKNFARNRKLKALKKAKAAAADCSSTTPACIKATYGIGEFSASTGTNSSVAVSGFIGQYFSPDDLSAFLSQYDPADQRNATVIGPNDPTNPGVEASLDIQYSMGVAVGVPATFWYYASQDDDLFLEFMLAVASTAHVPWVISTSYGEDEPGVSSDLATRINIEFQKAGVRGISILYSSGDGGVSGSQSQQCTTFIPTFPGGSPYVTSVGASTSFQPEVAASFSSGGFSNIWTPPAYQKAAVSAYLNSYGTSTLPPSNLYNAAGRGFPDISAQGTNYPVIVSGSTQAVEGTSCSSPTFAAIVSLLNDIRFAAGKSSLGFLNPLFYKNPMMFNDVTSGSNPGCNTNGFTATQGWDPVTGLGTPNFDAMAAVIKALP